MYPYNIENEEDDKINESITAASPPLSSRIPVKKTEEEMHRPKPDEKLLELIREAIKSEIKNSWEYKELIDYIELKEDKEIIRSIKMDSLKAQKLLKQIYMKMTGTNYEDGELPCDKSASQSNKGGIGEKLLDCMLGCLKDVEFYRKLHFAFMNLEIRDMFFEIITDNQCNSIKFMYMETKYR